MSDNKRQSQWMEILAVTQAMAEQAESEAWADLMLSETRRRQLLEAYFAVAAAPDEAAQLAEDLRKLLEIDRQMMTRVLHAREEIGTALRGMHTGRQANQAYAKASA